jgi:hypothetical protein
MDTQTITHVRPRDKTPLHRETTTRALRHSVWLSLYFAQNLQLQALEHRLSVTLIEVDALLLDFDDAA